MSRTPDVSCVIPAYQAERFLAEAIDSVLGQTHQSLELIVVDDGSTDRTAAVAESYGDRLRLIRQANGGYHSARNAGVEAARAPWVAFLDADDVWLPVKLERQLACFAARPTTDLCVTHFQNFWAPELADEAERYRDHPLGGPLSGYIAQTLLARREAFDRFGGIPEPGQGGDTLWFERAVRAGAVLEVLPEVLLRRRIHGQNHSLQGTQGVDDLFQLIRSRIRADAD